MKLKALCLALCMSATLSATTYADNFTKSDIEKIVKEYLINNPDVILEANNAAASRKAQLEKLAEQKIIESIYSNKNIPSSGAENPKHHIIEFFDYNCGYCKRAKPILLEILKSHPDTRYYYMEFPILSDISVKAAKVGLAIFQKDPAKYVQYSNEFMTRNGRLDNEISIQAFVEQLGFNWAEIDKLSESSEISKTLNEIRVFGSQLKVSGTPAFIVDGEVLRGAPRGKSDVESLLK
ncbi:MAG: DsbA family protein [Succinivibrionaceae bacterium]